MKPMKLWTMVRTTFPKTIFKHRIKISKVKFGQKGRTYETGGSTEKVELMRLSQTEKWKS